VSDTDWLKQPPAEPGMRIGLFGGSFNPAHEGHLLVAEQCLKRLALDRVWVMVSPGNPLKDHSELAPLEERVAGTRRVMSDPRIDVTAFEAERGFRYSYETVDWLVRAEPGVKFVWIMGGDSLATFDQWERWEQIARTIPMAVYARPGAGLRATRSKAATALQQFRLSEDRAATLAAADPPAWIYLRGVMSGQSSTAIRAAQTPGKRAD
jgi:nicotinate-nucleotide adenylyltransferase